MAPKKRKSESIADIYARIRKRVPPPSRVEQDRRRRLKDEIERREADADATQRGSGRTE